MRLFKETAPVAATAYDIAEAFWDLGSDEQAEFFRVLGDKHLLERQMAAVALCYALGDEGRQAMRTIGEVVAE